MKPWHERFPSIYGYERSFWLDKGFEQARQRPGEEISFTGTITGRVKLDQRLQERQFKLRVAYPPGYPYIPPRVEFIDPKIKRARHQGLDGAPCLFPPQAWTLNFPASEVHTAIERWLDCHLQGRFPRELALYELPEYLPYSSFSILAPPRLLDAIKDQSAGRFSVEVRPHQARPDARGRPLGRRVCRTPATSEQRSASRDRIGSRPFVRPRMAVNTKIGCRDLGVEKGHGLSI